MTAISVPSANLADLFFARTGTLEREVKKGGQILKAITGATGGFFQWATAQAQMVIAAKRVADGLKTCTTAMTDNTVWFRGFQATLESEPGKFSNEAIDQMMPHIARGQNMLKEFRGNLEEAKIPLAKASRSPRLRQSRLESVQRLDDAVIEVYAAIENVRWALLEQQADADIAAGNVSSAYSSASDLFASLQ